MHILAQPLGRQEGGFEGDATEKAASCDKVAALLQGMTLARACDAVTV